MDLHRNKFNWKDNLPSHLKHQLNDLGYRPDEVSLPFVLWLAKDNIRRIETASPDDETYIYMRDHEPDILALIYQEAKDFVDMFEHQLQDYMQDVERQNREDRGLF